jgi:hypothetical protein
MSPWPQSAGARGFEDTRNGNGFFQSTVIAGRKSSIYGRRDLGTAYGAGRSADSWQLCLKSPLDNLLESQGQWTAE